MKLSVVLPVFNEEAVLPELSAKLLTVLTALNMDFEVIFVDDGSTDQSTLIIKKLHDTDPRVKLIQLSRNFGQQIALSAGIDHASGDAVITMDSDLQHPPSVINDLIHAWQQGYEVVHTTRTPEKNQNSFKRWTSALFYRLFSALSDVPLPQGAGDLRLLDQRVVKSLRQMRERHRFLRGMVGWSGYKTIGISYQAAPRARGQSKYNLKKMGLLAMDGIVSFSTVPLRLSFYVGAIMASLGLVYLLYILYARFVTHHVIPGWTSLITLLILIGGMLLNTMGVIGIYVGKIFEEVKNRPLYIVRDSVGVQSS